MASRASGGGLELGLVRGLGLLLASLVLFTLYWLIWFLWLIALHYLLNISLIGLTLFYFGLLGLFDSMLHMFGHFLTRAF